MLDRIGDEVAVATSVVRYAPGSRFPVHVHEKGEEFLVLDGVFSDDDGNYPTGTYVRNPPGTSHAPWTDEGTTILVKLRQFAMTDLSQFAIDTSTAQWSDGKISGTNELRLHDFETESVRMLRLDAGVRVAERDVPGGEEIYVVSGEIRDTDGVWPADSWIRNPPGVAPAWAATNPAVVWLKTGHLDRGHGPAKPAASSARRQ